VCVYIVRVFKKKRYLIYELKGKYENFVFVINKKKEKKLKPFFKKSIDHFSKKKDKKLTI